MATNRHDFFDEYDSLVSDVQQALHQQFAGEVHRWLTLLESTEEISSFVERLGKKLDRDSWAQAYGVRSAGIGSGSISWPSEKEQRLGAQLDLFRLFARREWDAWQFAVNFLNTGNNNLNVMVGDVSRMIFAPMARDLRRLLDREWGNSVKLAPAADRVVSLDHNSQMYSEAIASLNRVRDTLAAQNDYDDVADKAQRLSELDASLDLLNAPQARVELFEPLTVRCLKYLGEKFGEGVIHVLVATALVALGALLGIHLEL